MNSSSCVRFGEYSADDAEQRGRFLLDRHTLFAHVLREFGQRHLHTVIDVDRVDVRIGAQFERDDQRVAAIVPAHALHVDHLVDADDLAFDRLRDRRLHDRGGSARVGRGHRDLRRDDVRILRDRDHQERDKARDRGDDGDDRREPRPVDEDAGEHRISSGWRRAASGVAITGASGADALHPLHDHLLAPCEAVVDRRHRYPCRRRA